MVFGDLLDAGPLGAHDGAVEPLRDDALDGHLGVLGERETGQRALRTSWSVSTRSRRVLIPTTALCFMQRHPGVLSGLSKAQRRVVFASYQGRHKPRRYGHQSRDYPIAFSSFPIPELEYRPIECLPIHYLALLLLIILET